MVFTPLFSLGAGTINLAWDASTNASVAGYNLYYGTASRNYQTVYREGMNLSAVATNLANGKTYYFAVTAVDSSGNESDFSNEINYSVPSVNQPPTISTIANQSVLVNNAAGPITFTINDPDTGPNGLILSAVSVNTTLVPTANIVFGGSGANRTVTVTPVAGQTGSAGITIKVSDGSLTAQTSFTLTVSAGQTNQPPTISAIANQTISANSSAGPIGFTVNDPDSGPNGLILSAISANTTLAPAANIVFGGSGANRTVTVTPAAGQTGSAGITIKVSDGSLTAQTSFTLTVTAMQTNQPPPPATLQKTSLKNSTYSGLFYEQDAVRMQSAGGFRLTATAAGKYSGTVQMAAGKYSFSGQFGTLCESTNVIARKGTNSLVLHFNLKGDGSGQVAGDVSDGTWTAQVYANQAPYNSKTNIAPYAGSYTMQIPGATNAPAFTLGNSFGSVKVDGSGNVKLTGTLADGTKISESSPLSADGMWPLFLPLYKGKGLVMGWVSFTNRINDDLHGPVNWIKLQVPKTKYYVNGLSVQSEAAGSVFVPGARQPLVFGAAKLQLGSVGSGVITSLKLSATTGIFSGSMLNTTTGKPVPFQGALLQKVQTGYGFLLQTNQSTPVVLTP